ncbi:MAG: hypothetical protein R3F33_08435 [Planctomycetota bacterium]
MKAVTHTEIYRPYEGHLRPRPPVERILAWAGIRLSFRKKLPALLLFTPPAIAALVGCVTVHLMFTMSSQAKRLGGARGQVFSEGLKQLLRDVSEAIYRFLQVNQFLALLVIAWYGSALIAEDKRLQANLLYFARPVTPLRYILGKLGTAAFLGTLTLFVPAMLICWQAAFSSPDWSFLKQNSWVIWRVCGYSVIWILVMSTLVVAISSCFSRRALTLVATFALIFLLDGATQVAVEVTGNQNFGLLSPNRNFFEIAEHLFHKPNLGDILLQASGEGMESLAPWNIEGSYWALGLMTLLALSVLWRNVRKMEVIA